jgi:hypothetical protein
VRTCAPHTRINYAAKLPNKVIVQVLPHSAGGVSCRFVALLIATPPSQVSMLQVPSKPHFMFVNIMCPCGMLSKFFFFFLKISRNFRNRTRRYTIRYAEKSRNFGFRKSRLHLKLQEYSQKEMRPKISHSFASE